MFFISLKKSTIIQIAFSLVVIVVLSIMLSATKAYNVVNGRANRELPIYYVKTNEKKVAISFDCAWGVDYTDRLLEVMENEKVKSTFFTVEFWSRKYPEYLSKISQKGHEIGTHSATHPYMSKLSKEEIKKELNTSIIAIESITKKKVQLFRPPYGDYNDLLIQTAREMGIYTIQWDVDSLDWKDLSASEITKRVVKRVKNGSIVLFHNQGLHTAEALPQIILELKQQGYEFVTIGELIYKDNYQMLSDGGQLRNS